MPIIGLSDLACRLGTTEIAIGSATPSRFTTRCRARPAGVRLVVMLNRMKLTSPRPLIETISSPGRSPASKAGDPASTAPRTAGISFTPAM